MWVILLLLRLCGLFKCLVWFDVFMILSDFCCFAMLGMFAIVFCLWYCFLLVWLRRVILIAYLILLFCCFWVCWFARFVCVGLRYLYALIWGLLLRFGCWFEGWCFICVWVLPCGWVCCLLVLLCIAWVFVYWIVLSCVSLFWWYFVWIDLICYGFLVYVVSV